MKLLHVYTFDHTSISYCPGYNQNSRGRWINVVQHCTFIIIVVNTGSIVTIRWLQNLCSRLLMMYHCSEYQQVGLCESLGSLLLHISNYCFTSHTLKLAYSSPLITLLAACSSCCFCLWRCVSVDTISTQSNAGCGFSKAIWWFCWHSRYSRHNFFNSSKVAGNGSSLELKSL